MRSFIAALSLGCAVSVSAFAAPVEIQWWHAMTGANNDRVNQLVDGFNASQSDYKVVATFKSNDYTELMNQTIAAYRAGNAPHITQVFEVGTATMMAAKGAVKPVYELMAEAGEKFDPNVYLPAIKAYYSTAQGKMLSMPFNSSTPIFYYNKDAFAKAGLDPEKAPKTWPEVIDAAKKVRASGHACGLTTAWVTWTQMETFSAWHNISFGTKANGFGGFDTEFKFNNPTIVKHFETLNEMQKDGSFKYGGRTTQPEGLFLSGECAMIMTSSGFLGNAIKNAKFNFATGMLPYYPDVAGAPQNSIIGGATLWVMGGKKAQEYKGVAKFFTYLSQLDVQIVNHQQTGYLPVTIAAYQETKRSGFYDRNPGRETPILQLQNKTPTENSFGVRFGNLPKIRDLIMDEVEAAFAGKISVKQAMDNAVAKGNEELRRFERTVAKN
ncbi:sn-glycerol-3-phosphate ABC transporter substrate-binding protein UgpB [Elstera cyanobacteriorum]|uniref:sn-glycerol-3-phosphate-binding periplasmic protein UgpB n=1 Tax=Elstera cyanobacteriorum TaxID=2022747 RepID=A0A255XSG3_9PROT|nr:sn-glycerol-3-phosphate ABC transporter substrate-binding protein UgpB [Elstera cyanobacteriorum]MCK6441828.1 sn-glycerol-3-phosphate ABC transporter substrate-binding protein UgpB [Elstera cyanobacteriorum]OYQ19831.1 sn-glycerol-3-phosphate ABC transporter substrate-binding protein [Elstera cyanobacteriorum]GFZ95892.1 ABC transporter substrate-binding protein [Elstera cyanobacteriorum]